MSIASVMSVLGWTVSLFAAAMAVPALLAFGYEENTLGLTFLGTAGLTLFAGGALIIATRGAVPTRTKTGTFLIAGLTFVVLAFFGALPFYLSGVAPSATDAYFEAMSGLTTGGATIFYSVENLPRSILLWRAELQWIGGLAAILLTVTILSFSAVGGMNLFVSAIPVGGVDSLPSRLRETALSISWVYALLTLAAAAALLLAGMPAFDALAHALSTLSTGGFSTRDAGIAAFSDPWIESVLIVFMIVGALNFTLHGALFHGRTAPHRRDNESRYLLAIAGIGALLCGGALWALHETGLWDSVRIGVFSAVSALTTTGYSVVSGAESRSWPTMIPVVLMGLMLIGGAAGSTAGGIKLMRIIVFVKLAARELLRLAHPHGVVRLRYAGRAIDEDTLRAIWGFLTIFITGFVLIALALGLLGFDFRDALSAAAVTLTNTGAAWPLIGGGESFAESPVAAKWVLALSMVIGRLELVSVLVLLSPAFWRY